MKRIAIVLLGLASVYSASAWSAINATPLFSTPSSPERTLKSPITLALSEAEAAACRAEEAQLQQRLSACGDNQQCRAELQAAIQAHNNRCR